MPPTSPEPRTALPAPARRTAAPGPGAGTLACCCLALAGLAAALVLTVRAGGTLGNPRPLYGWYLLDAALFAAAVLLLRRVPLGRARWLVPAGSVLLALTGLLAPPRTSDDAYRYVWDGQVQAAGISPYAYAPDDPALAGLRADAPALFPAGGPCTSWDERRAAGGFCSHVNRPAVHTVYPPVAEAWFAGLYATTGGRLGVRAAQLGGALLAVGTTGALLSVLRRRSPERLWQAALWGWCPGVVVWAVNDAHVDTLGALLMVAALGVGVGRGVGPGAGVAQRGRAVGGGALLGAAVATKLLPALALPGLLSGAFARRPADGPTGRDAWRGLRPALGALAAFVCCYLPYVFASGAGVLGYLPGYLHEEGYDQQHITRFALLRLLLPDHLAPYAAAVVLLAVVLYVLRAGDPRRPWQGALLVTGSALLVTSPGYPWYGLLVVALVALDGRWEWLAVPAAAQVVYLGHGQVLQGAYAAALALVLTAVVLRRSGNRPGGPHRPVL